MRIVGYGTCRNEIDSDTNTFIASFQKRRFSYMRLYEGMANGTGSFAREESQPKLEETNKTSPQTTTVLDHQLGQKNLLKFVESFFIICTFMMKIYTSKQGLHNTFS